MKACYYFLIFLLYNSIIFSSAYAEYLGGNNVPESDSTLVDQYIKNCFENKSIDPDSALTCGIEAFRIAKSIGNNNAIKEIINNIKKASLNNKDFYHSQEYILFLLLLSDSKNLSDQGKITVFDSLASYYLSKKEYGSALVYFQQILNTNADKYILLSDSQNKRIRKNLADCYMKIGNEYFQKQLFDKALENHFNSLELFYNDGDKTGVAKCYNNIGIVYTDMGLFPKAMLYLLKSLKVNEEIKNDRLIANNYLNMGVIFQRQKEYKKAMDFYKTALQMSEKKGYKEIITKCCLNIGGVYDDEKNFIKSIEFYHYSLKIFKELNDNYGINCSLLNIGTAYLNLEDNNKALMFFRKSYNMAEQHDYRFLLSMTCLNFAELYLRQEKNDSVVYYANKALNYSDLIDIRNKVYLELKEAYYLKKDYKKALEYTKLYQLTSDSIFDKEKKKQLLEIQTKYETEKKDNLINLKNLELSFKDKIITVYKYGFFVVLFFLFFITYFFVQKHQKNRLLIKQNKEIVKIVQDQKTQLSEEFVFQKNLETHRKYNTSSLDEEKKKEFFKKIQYLLNDEKVYRDRELTLEKLADLVDSNRTYVSQVINDLTGTNFNTFINNFRINEARVFLADPKNVEYPIKSIYDLFGFKSEKYFSDVFKKQSGFSPASYRRKMLT